MRVREDFRALTGPEKAAILMLALGEEHTRAPVRADGRGRDQGNLPDHGAISARCARSVVERLFVEFAEQHVRAPASLVGSYESTERLLAEDAGRASASTQIMEEIRGPAGRTMWDKLGNVNEAVLANYLKNEYPQTVAVVLSKIKPDHAARVLALLPEELRPGSGHAHAAHGERCRRTCSTTSSRRCAPSSCPTSRAPPGATRTR